MKKIKFPAILFDMDGTLIDSGQSIARHFIQALDENKIEHRIDEPLLIEHLELPFEELNTLFALGMNNGKFERFLETYRKNYLLDPITNTTVYSGAFEVLTFLKQNGIRLALATGKQMDVTHKIMRLLKLDSFFECLQGFEGGMKPKPSPDILQKALDCLRMDAKECLMVGDTHVDLQAGQALGMTTVAALYGFGKQKTLEKYRPDRWLHALKDLPTLLENLP
jgi:phosphoglycolate phosphatase-like HAD superfamily hydrolase